MWKLSPKVKNLRPAMKNFFKIWSANKKVWPPLLYGILYKYLRQKLLQGIDYQTLILLVFAVKFKRL